MPVTINGTTGITTPDLDSTADISANGVNFGEGGGSIATNTSAGNGALASNTTGSNNTAIGYQAGNSHTTETNSTFVGYRAGYTGNGGQNTFVGYQAGLNSGGFGNTALGYLSMQSVTGYQNGAFGRLALRNLTTGFDNTAVGGNNAGSLITTGIGNTVLGHFDGNQNGLDIRTSNYNVVLADGNGVPRQWSDSTNTTYRYGNTNAYSWNKSLSGVVTAASSGSSKKLCQIGPTGALTVRVMVIQGSENNSGSATANISMAYGNNTTGTHTTSVIGNISGISLAYDNGGSPIYTINCTVTYSGAAPTIYYVIEGLSTYNFAPQ